MPPNCTYGYADPTRGTIMLFLQPYSGGTSMSLSLPPVPPHASQASLPPPKHSLHLMETTPLPLQISHSTTPFSVVSFPVPLHSSHLAGIEPVPLHLPQLTSPVPLHVVHTKMENLILT